MRSKNALLGSALVSIALHAGLLVFANKLGTSAALVGERVAPVSLLHASLMHLPQTAVQEAPVQAEYLPADSAGGTSATADAVQRGATAHQGIQRNGLLYSPLDFIPREYLSFVPKSLAEIEIPFPDSVTGEVRLQLQLTLFIDEKGLVQKVQVDDSRVPAPLEDAAVNAFLRARFKPGEIDGQVVRSLIRVEVTFEAKATDPAGVLRKPSISM